ncbi:MAG: alpha/beta fold hydrolase [Gammaproteobacteria bacterium]
MSSPDPAAPALPYQLQMVDAGDGYRVPLFWHAAAQPRANIVLMAALGVAARFYLPLAQDLCAAGLNVALVEQRGHGESGLRPSRRTDFGFRHALLHDIPAVLDHVGNTAPGLPLYLMGHSLGGHYAAITAGRLPHRVDGVIVAACGTPWIGAFRGRIRSQLKLLVRLVPALNLLLGYYPGDRVGFGGREARTLMADWRDLAIDNRYRARGLDEDLEAGIARYRGPVLSLRMADDTYAPEAAMTAVTDKFIAGRVTRRLLTADDLGDRADHFRWARSPSAVTREVSAWLAGPAPDGSGPGPGAAP